jgi:hypothetical protein
VDSSQVGAVPPHGRLAGVGGPLYIMIERGRPFARVAGGE